MKTMAVGSTARLFGIPDLKAGMFNYEPPSYAKAQLHVKVKSVNEFC
jgi:hypothetical protein